MPEAIPDYGPSTYGERIAGVYDAWHEGAPDVLATVAVLADLARGGRALELGIGTGRVALPLAAQGVEAHGIDASEAMVARLRAKPGGAQLPVTIGDFAGVPVDGTFSLIFVVFNTFFALPSQAEQVRCFRSVASHLAPDGLFLIEAFVPDLTRYVRGQSVWTTRVDLDEVRLTVAQHDPVGQRVVSQHVVLAPGGVRLYPVQLRYAWPSELDLMAQLAGLSLRERWADWQRRPFSAESARHISLYGHAPP
jgi:SAM-dependent methyltransferase